MHRTTIVKYTKCSAEELKKSSVDPESCVTGVQSNEILSLRPRDCEHIVKGVRRCVMDKIGQYNPKVNGIVLGYSNIRVENPLSAFRMDSPYLHVRATIDYYVFQPRLGSTLRGIVNYVSKEFVSAMLYQVFNVTVKLNGKANKHGTVKKGCLISFIVKSCDMKSEIPVIDGELVPNKAGEVCIKTEPTETEDVELTPTIEEVVIKEEINENGSARKKQSKKAKKGTETVTNGETSPQAEETDGAGASAAKDLLIRSLLSDMFDDLDEEPSVGKKRKHPKSKKTPKDGDEQELNGSTSKRNSYQNGTSAPVEETETSNPVKKRKIRFDLNDTVVTIKSEPTESKKMKKNKV